MPLDSTLYLSVSLEPLAEKLCELLDQESASGRDPFAPATIVAPSNDVKTWLQVRLAMQHGVAINIRVQYLESLLWTILDSITEMPLEAPVARLEHNRYRLLVMAILLEHADDPDLAPIRQWTQSKEPGSREYCRKLWDVSDRLARLIREYEYHRQSEIIHEWIFGGLALTDAQGDSAALERCQCAIFKRIVDPESGVRARISRAQGKTFKTLPQYAQEVMEGNLKDAGQWAALRARPIHIFGVSQISPYHIHLLRWLGSRLALRIYHVNPILSQFDPEGRGSAFTRLQKTASAKPRDALAHDRVRSAWTQAGVASLRRMSELLDPKAGKAPFGIQFVSTPPRGTDNVLKRIQHDLLQPRAAVGERLPQDTSLQVVACPGIFREVETVYQSILHNLQTNPTLNQNEIAVLVADMNLYRPVIQSVFERNCEPGADFRDHPRSPISYSLSECPAAEFSTYGQALLAMFDAALEGFPRSRVLNLLSNPCVLARLNADPDQPAIWLKWAEQLAVYHGWDRQDKRESGYTDSRLYSWCLALQRLRLGRIMETPGSDPDAPLPKFHDIVPYADLESADARQLDVFCRAVEELLRALAHFRRVPATGAMWAERIRRLMDTFLDIPETRAEESLVRATIVSSLELLKTLDAATSRPQELAMPLIREFIAAQMDEISLSAGGRFGGVTIAPLQSVRPLPYKIVYVLGLGEGLFPAPDVVSPFDLRQYAAPLPGDIRMSEVHRQQFLELLCAAREKVYLLYCSREIQKDQKLYPGSMINRLIAYVEEAVLVRQPGGGLSKFQIARAPLYAHDSQYIFAPSPQMSAYSDAIVTYQRSHRLLALQEAAASGAVASTPELKKLLEHSARANLRPAIQTSTGDTEIAQLRIRSLCTFLNNPAKESIKRHLRLRSEDEREPGDDEPLATPEFDERDQVQAVLTRYVRTASGETRAEPSEYVAKLAQSYENLKLQGLAPEGVFADIELARMRSDVRRRLLDANGMAALARKHRSEFFCGSLQLGSALTPTGARTCFPALRLNAGALTASLSGAFNLIWRDERHIEALLISHGVTRDKEGKLSYALFEPVLLYLALLAGDEPNGDGVTSRAWVGARSLTVSIAHQEGICEYDYSGITAAQARDYLESLVRDYLSLESFDVLPFNIISEKLSNVYELPDGSPELEQLETEFMQKLQEAIDKKEFDRSDISRLEPVDLIQTPVAADAFETVRRRFHLLDLGPRTNRNKS